MFGRYNIFCLTSRNVPSSERPTTSSAGRPFDLPKTSPGGKSPARVTLAPTGNISLGVPVGTDEAIEDMLKEYQDGQDDRLRSIVAYALCSSTDVSGPTTTV